MTHSKSLRFCPKRLLPIIAAAPLYCSPPDVSKRPAILLRESEMEVKVNGNDNKWE
jgi:hypothetical protein